MVRKKIGTVARQTLIILAIYLAIDVGLAQILPPEWLDPGKRAIETNRATALLLTGRASEARAVYDVLKTIPHPRDPRLTWIEYVKDDLALLRRLGITSPDLEQVAKELGS